MGQPAARAKLTLTFDNGPTPGLTESVLATLADFQVRATFFLVGKRLVEPGARRLAEQARAQGHWIGNHTFSHGLPLGLQSEAGVARREILGMRDELGELAGDNLYFRPNGLGKLGPHLLNEEAVDVLREIGATVVLWTSVPKDRKIDVASPDAWLEQAQRDVRESDWSLLVLHDRPAGHADAEPMSYLPQFLQWARDYDVEIVQDFPDHCVPIRRGKVLWALDGLVSTCS